MDCIATPRTFDMEALKQPRGFLRCLQWFFAMLAFAVCADFSTSIGFDIVCKDETKPTTHITTTVQYPFRLDHNPPITFGEDLPCGVSSSTDKNYDITFPGNSASDAQFFVFTGVITWLYCFLSLAIYVFYSSLYADEQKNYPKVDFVISALLAMFWLAGSSAWGNGLSGLKNDCDPDTWIFNNENEYAAICFLNTNGKPQYAHVKECLATSRGAFGGANVSVLLGFLNFFLWASNLWFLYKETKWFKGGNQTGSAVIIEDASTEE